MKTRKKIFSTAVVLALGATLSWSPLGNCMDAEDAPDSVEIDVLSKLYTPVEFDHIMHTEYASCVECHHHTAGHKLSDPNCIRCHKDTPEADTVACADCHNPDRFSHADLKSLEDPRLYHIDKPGLKGAFHINCIGCHQIIDGPTGCQDCHQYTDAGKKRFNTGEYAPKDSKQPSSAKH